MHHLARMRAHILANPDGDGNQHDIHRTKGGNAKRADQRAAFGIFIGAETCGAIGRGAKTKPRQQAEQFIAARRITAPAQIQPTRGEGNPRLGDFGLGS